MENKIEKYCAEHSTSSEDLSDSEIIFLRAYVRFLKSNPRVKEFVCFDFSPIDYFNVSEYLGVEAGQDIIFNSENWPRDITYDTKFDMAIAFYRLQYILDTIGNTKLSDLISEMIDAKKFNLFERISKALGLDVETIYSPLEKIRPSQMKLGRIEKAKFEQIRKWRLSNLSGEALHRAEKMIELEELFSRPILIDFSQPERAAIITMIYQMSDDEFVYNNHGIGYFLANFLLHETEWSFKEILPVAIHLMTETPIRQPESPTASEVSWLCSEIIERCYKLLPNDKTVQKHYEDLIYQIYWPRIGSLWPLLHWHEFEFKETFKREDLIEAANYILNLPDIEKRNPEIAAYLKSSPKNKLSTLDPLPKYHKHQYNDAAAKIREPADYDALRTKTLTFQSHEIAPLFKKPYKLKTKKEKT